MSDQGAPTADAGITVVIPAYNEEQGLAGTLQQLLSVLKDAGLPHEIIVVDDGSTDHTPGIAAQFEEVVLLKHATNRGYGASLKRGIAAARYAVIAITDADGTYPSSAIPRLASLLTGDTDMVVGWRKGFAARIPLLRRPAKWAIEKLAQSLAGYAIPDLNSGLRVFRREIALGHDRLLPDGFSFTTTITLLIASAGGKIVYDPIPYADRKGRSKFHPITDTWNMITLIVRSVLLFNPLRVFVPIALGCLALAAAVLVYALLFLDRVPDGTVSVLAVAGIQILVMGLLADLINRRAG